MSCCRSVRGRRPLGQEAELDYEVMSDQDWEEEPEGESLSVSDSLLYQHCRNTGTLLQSQQEMTLMTATLGAGEHTARCLPASLECLM
jgi:hypothetical protein